MTEAEWLSGRLTNEQMVDFCATIGSERKLRLFLLACCDRIERGLIPGPSRVVLDAMRRYLEGPPDPDKLLDLQSFAQQAYNVVGQPYDVEEELDPSAESEVAQAVLCLTNPSLTTSWKAGEPSPWTWAAIYARLAIHKLVRRTEGRDQANAVEAAEMSIQVGMLRDVFGNPFRSVPSLMARREVGESSPWARARLALYKLVRRTQSRDQTNAAAITFSPLWLTSTAVALASQMYESRDFSAMPILGDALQDAGCDSAEVLNHCRAPGVHVRGCWVVDLVLGKE